MSVKLYLKQSRILFYNYYRTNKKHPKQGASFILPINEYRKINPNGLTVDSYYGKK